MHPYELTIANKHWKTFEEYFKDLESYGVHVYSPRRVLFRECVFEGVFQSPQIWEFRDCLFEYCFIQNANFSYAHFERTSFRATVFREVEWREAIIQDPAPSDIASGVYPFHLLRIGPIGSRADTLQVQYFPVTPSPVVIRTGCFRGDWATFTEAIRQKPQHDPARKEYEAALPYIQNWIRMME